MIESIASWLIQQPGHILLVAAFNIAAWLFCRASLLRDVPNSNLFWIPALLCTAYAAWEWWLQVESPEADIRVDLLLIWPVVGIAMAWAVARAAYAWWSVRQRQD